MPKLTRTKKSKRSQRTKRTKRSQRSKRSQTRRKIRQQRGGWPWSKSNPAEEEVAEAEETEAEKKAREDAEREAAEKKRLKPRREWNMRNFAAKVAPSLASSWIKEPTKSEIDEVKEAQRAEEAKHTKKFQMSSYDRTSEEHDSWVKRNEDRMNAERLQPNYGAWSGRDTPIYETKPKINNYTYLNADGVEVPY